MKWEEVKTIIILTLTHNFQKTHPVFRVVFVVSHSKKSQHFFGKGQFWKNSLALPPWNCS